MRARLPWILAAAYALLFTLLGIVKYDVHRNFVDFGIFSQTAASAFGCFCNAIEGSHWAYHFSPILYLAGLALLLWHSAATLIALQSVACALTIPPIYAIVAKRAPPHIAALSAFVTALYPALAGLAFVDFHENAFAPAAIAWAAWAWDSGFRGYTLLFAVIAIAVKEDQAIFVGVAGAGTALFARERRDRMLAGTIGLLGLGTAALFFLVVQPAHAPAAGWSPERFYAWTARDFGELIPRGLLARLGFLALVFLPLALLPLRSRVFWFAVPPLAEVLLSRMSTTYTLGTHYAGAWLGYVLVAMAFAVRAMDPQRARRALWIAIGFCAIELAVANPMHPGMNLRAVQPRDRRLDQMLATLPADASIATQEEAYTHLALRDPYARLLPQHSSTPIDACFVLIDRAFPDSPRLEEYGPAFMRLVQRGRYVLIRHDDGVRLYRANGSCR